MNSGKSNISLRFLAAILALGLFTMSTTLPAPQAWALEPCCTVVSVDKTGVVTLRDNKTGQIEKVKVTDPAQLAALKQGQPVDRSIGMPLPGHHPLIR